jgi:hypothetical protein
LENKTRPRLLGGCLRFLRCYLRLRLTQFRTNVVLDCFAQLLGGIANFLILIWRRRRFWGRRLRLPASRRLLNNLECDLP